MQQTIQQVSVKVEAGGQSEFWARVAQPVQKRAPRRPVRVPRVRPLADEELAESFVKAAAAWAQWTERRRRAGR